KFVLKSDILFSTFKHFGETFFGLGHLIADSAGKVVYVQSALVDFVLDFVGGIAHLSHELSKSPCHFRDFVRSEKHQDHHQNQKKLASAYSKHISIFNRRKGTSLSLFSRRIT